MAKKRYNVQEVAEVLIDEIEAFKELHKKGQKVNTEELETLVERIENYKISTVSAEIVRDDFIRIQKSLEETNKTTLSDLKRISEESQREIKKILETKVEALKKGSLIPQWVFISMLVVLFASFSLVAYSFYQNKDLKEQISNYNNVWREIPNDVKKKAIEKAKGG
jgi:hypothetical protein